MKKYKLNVWAKPFLATSILLGTTVVPLSYAPHAYASVSTYQSQMDSYSAKIVAFQNQLEMYVESMDTEEDMDAYSNIYDNAMVYYENFINGNHSYVNTLNPDLQAVNTSLEKIFNVQYQLLYTQDQWYNDEIDDDTFQNKMIDLISKGMTANDEVINLLTNYQSKYHVTYSADFEDFIGQHFEEANTTTYTVKKGDTLYKVAKNNGMTVQELKSLNGLTSDAVKIGQVLKLKASSNDNASSEVPYTYKVQKGDTLYSVAKKNNLTVAALKSLNGLKSETLKLGQVLKVKKTYTVKKGDTLYRIAVSNSVSVANIKSYNHLTSDAVKVGQVLVLN